MLGNLLQQLQQQYGLQNAPNAAPAAGTETYGMGGLLGSTGIPYTANPIGMRTPDYLSLMGRFGQQSLNYSGGMFQPPGASATVPSGSSYLDTINAATPIVPQQSTGPIYKNYPRSMWDILGGVVPSDMDPSQIQQFLAWSAAQGGAGE